MQGILFCRLCYCIYVLCFCVCVCGGDGGRGGVSTTKKAAIVTQAVITVNIMEVRDAEEEMERFHFQRDAERSLSPPGG